MAVSIGEGATYAPRGKPAPVVEPGEFEFAAAYLDHGHIYGQTNGLIEAGATLTHVYDPSPERLRAYQARYPEARAVASFTDLLENDRLQLIAAAAIPDQRAAIGARVIKAGKHYFTDKPPFTTLEQLETLRGLIAEHQRRYFVYYSERVHNEAAWHAGELIAQGAVGRVLHVLILAPHRLSRETRPEWFFDKARYGGIITDIGSHQVEQFLAYANCESATVEYARARNLNHPDLTGLEDFGELALVGDNGASCYARLDWFTPSGLPVWGDGRTFITGTAGTLELRKYVDPARQAPASIILRADGESVEAIDCLGKVGFPFFGQMILDALNGTETAMTQAHIFRAAELSMRAQALADRRHADGEP